MAKAYVTPLGMRKRCCKCGIEMTLDKFHKSSKTSDGLNPRCAKCQSEAVKKCLSDKEARGLPKLTEEQRQRIRERKRQYYSANPEKYRKLTAEYRATNPEKYNASVVASRRKKPEATRMYALDYYKRNAEKIRPRHTAQSMKRYARKANATPSWADQSAIRQFYVEAARITKETGIKHEVDHIVPIMGRTVCGLHVEWNLQIIEKSENIRKGNREWPDKPHQDAKEAGRFAVTE